ncbi:hypothetical protein [Desulfosarcina ovata]|nr:hypothetical protein [Desulfosarcina ovata]
MPVRAGHAREELQIDPNAVTLAMGVDLNFSMQYVVCINNFSDQ